MNNNIRVEVEEIGRGNITNAIHNSNLGINGGQQQVPGTQLTSMPPPVNYSQTGGPPPHFHLYGAPPQASQAPGALDGASGGQGDGSKPSKAKICKKLVHGTCEYGLSGQFNGNKCPEPYPQACLGWKKIGRDGCSKGP